MVIFVLTGRLGTYVGYKDRNGERGVLSSAEKEEDQF